MAQRAPIHPSLCRLVTLRAQPPRTATDYPCCFGVSGEQGTPKLGPHSSVLTPALAGPITSHCCDWHSSGDARWPQGTWWQTKWLLTPVPTPFAAGAWRPPFSRAGAEGREASTTPPAISINPGQRGGAPGTAQARLLIGKAWTRPGLALAALRGHRWLHARPQGPRVSSKRSSLGTYRQRLRRVKTQPNSRSELRRAGGGPYLPPVTR